MLFKVQSAELLRVNKPAKPDVHDKPYLKLKLKQLNQAYNAIKTTVVEFIDEDDFAEFEAKLAKGEQLPHYNGELVEVETLPYKVILTEGERKGEVLPAIHRSMRIFDGMYENGTHFNSMAALQSRANKALKDSPDRFVIVEDEATTPVLDAQPII